MCGVYSALDFIIAVLLRKMNSIAGQKHPSAHSLSYYNRACLWERKRGATSLQLEYANWGRLGGTDAPSATWNRLPPFASPHHPLPGQAHAIMPTTSPPETEDSMAASGDSRCACVYIRGSARQPRPRLPAPPAPSPLPRCAALHLLRPPRFRHTAAPLGIFVFPHLGNQSPDARHHARQREEAHLQSR